VNRRFHSLRQFGFCGVLFGLGSLLSAGAGLVQAEPTPATPAPVADAPEIKRVVYGFFDDQTGQRTGVLRIGTVGLEYRRHGFLQVAWRPLVVLSAVDLDIGENMAWPAEGTQITHALLALGGKNELALRHVRLRLAGSPGREVTAPTARLLPGGTLELLEATLAVTGDPPSARPTGTFRLMLTGPQAGRLIRTSPSTSLRDLDKLAVNNPPPAFNQ